LFSRLEFFCALGFVTLTGVLFSINLNYHSRTAAQQFETLTQDGIDVLNARMQTYLLVIKGAAAFVAASDDVSASDFATYTERLDLVNQLPSITGIGLVVEVPNDRAASFAQKMRTEVDPSFNFRRLSQEDTHFVIKYMEPAHQNTKAIGLDLTFDQERAEVVRQSRDTGSPRLTPPIVLIQAEASRNGAALFMPIHAATSAGGDDGTFVGWISAAFVVNDILSGLTSALEQSYYLNPNYA